MRENLRENNLLEDYLEKYPYRLIHRFLDGYLAPGVSYEPMRNYLDVSVVEHGAPQRHPSPQGSHQTWGFSGGCEPHVRMGLLHAEMVRSRDPPEEEKVVLAHLWGCGDWA